MYICYMYIGNSAEVFPCCHGTTYTQCAFWHGGVLASPTVAQATAALCLQSGMEYISTSPGNYFHLLGTLCPRNIQMNNDSMS